MARSINDTKLWRFVAGAAAIVLSVLMLTVFAVVAEGHDSRTDLVLGCVSSGGSWVMDGDQGECIRVGAPVRDTVPPAPAAPPQPFIEPGPQEEPPLVGPAPSPDTAPVPAPEQDDPDDPFPDLGPPIPEVTP